MQELSPGLYEDEGIFIRTGWDGPTGHFTRGDVYGLKFGSVFFRLDINHDPIAAVKARLPQTVEGLTEALASKKVFVSQCAAQALIELGPPAAPTIPEMFRLLEAGEGEMEYSIVELVKNAGAAAIPALDRALASGSANCRRVAALALGEIGSDAITMKQPLALALDDVDPSVVLASASALRKIDKTDTQAVPKLMGFLASEDVSVKFGAVQALGEYGEYAAPAVPFLLPILEAKVSGFPGAQVMTVMTLGKIGAAAGPAIPMLVNLAKNGEQTYAVIEALSLMGDEGVRAIIELHPKGKGENFIPWMKAIMRLGPNAAAAVTPLLEDLQKGKGMRRVFAAMALGEIGEKARVAIPTLEMLMNDPQTTVRLRAAEALWRLDGRTNMVLPLMMAELKTWASNTNALHGRTMDGSGESREQVAARVLGEMGPVAIEAKPQLRLMTKSSFVEIRIVAWVSLKKIQPAGKME